MTQEFRPELLADDNYDLKKSQKCLMGNQYWVLD